MDPGALHRAHQFERHPFGVLRSPVRAKADPLRSWSFFRGGLSGAKSDGRCSERSIIFCAAPTPSGWRAAHGGSTGRMFAICDKQ